MHSILLTHERNREREREREREIERERERERERPWCPQKCLETAYLYLKAVHKLRMCSSLDSLKCSRLTLAGADSNCQSPVDADQPVQFHCLSESKMHEQKNTLNNSKGTFFFVFTPWIRACSLNILSAFGPKSVCFCNTFKWTRSTNQLKDSNRNDVTLMSSSDPDTFAVLLLGWNACHKWQVKGAQCATKIAP